MMKVAAIALFAALFVTTANAQSVKYPKMHFGIRLGGTFNSASTSGLGSDGEHDNDVKGKNFLTGGLALDFRLAQIPLYMETGAYYVDRSVSGRYYADCYNVQVPVLLSYHHYISDNSAIQPFAGGFVAVSDDFGYGVRLGVGINYGRLYANVGYDIDLAEKDLRGGYRSGTYTSSGFFATIGFNFGGSR